MASIVCLRLAVVIAVPDYKRAKAWAKVAEPPAREDFSEQLDAFRKGNEGAFTLVSRVDGIDLPHDTCRIMIMEGLPSGSSLLERYQWEFLRMNNVHAVRVANRLAQLIGREVQEGVGIDSHKQAIELIKRVLGREEDWLDYYQREVKLAELDQDQLAQHNVAAADAEHQQQGNSRDERLRSLAAGAASLQPRQ